jgi:D-cysteine desulfhydrase family pyridoxal phosphate-dependent enzyme
MATALNTLLSLPFVTLAEAATPVERLGRLEKALGLADVRLLTKRDDLLSFAMGGNKVRKLQALAAEAIAAGADTLITCGGVQSNHARVTAAAGAALGLDVILVLNGAPPAEPTGNTRLDLLFGAEIRYVPSRDDRAPAMEAIAADLTARGKRPFMIPLGGSTPTGALGVARAIGEIAAAGVKPDVIVHASSSGGTQAGLVAGCALFGLRTKVVGISADAAASELEATVRDLLRRIARRLGASDRSVGADDDLEVDDRFVGAGYGIPTPASTDALTMVARTEGVVLDPVYTAKAMAGLFARLGDGTLGPGKTILFWHTGGQPGVFA